MSLSLSDRIPEMHSPPVVQDLLPDLRRSVRERKPPARLNDYVSVVNKTQNMLTCNHIDVSCNQMDVKVNVHYLVKRKYGRFLKVWNFLLRGKLDVS